MRGRVAAADGGRSTPGEKSEAFVAKLGDRIERRLDALENASTELVAGEVMLDQIVVACALEYTSLRYSDDWRAKHSGLATWLGEFTTQPSMISTRPVG